MLTEVIRLPVEADGAEPLLDFMGSHAYFQQDALRSHRLFRNEDEPEVLVIIEWNSRQDMDETSANDLSTQFRAEIAPLLAGAPVLGFYAETGR